MNLEKMSEAYAYTVSVLKVLEAMEDTVPEALAELLDKATDIFASEIFLERVSRDRESKQQDEDKEEENE